MANAITDIEKSVPNQAHEQAQALKELMEAAAKNHEALLALMGIVEELHKLGVLNALQAMLQNKQQIAVIGLGQLNKPGAYRIIKNAMGAVGFLSRLDPAKLQKMMNGVVEGVDRAGGGDADGRKKQGGMWGMLKAIREPEVLSSLNVMTDFLRGMGKGLKQPQGH